MFIVVAVVALTHRYSLIRGLNTGSNFAGVEEQKTNEEKNIYAYVGDLSTAVRQSAIPYYRCLADRLID